MIEGLSLGCKEHAFIVTEVDSDGHGWRCMMLMCSKCLTLLPYKAILQLNKQKQISAEIINNN